VLRRVVLLGVCSLVLALTLGACTKTPSGTPRATTSTTGEQALEAARRIYSDWQANDREAVQLLSSREIAATLFDPNVDRSYPAPNFCYALSSILAQCYTTSPGPSLLFDMFELSSGQWHLDRVQMQVCKVQPSPGDTICLRGSIAP
jgi:hypothetical protein